MKKYRIVCVADLEQGSKRRWNIRKVLKYSGYIPVKWVHDDNDERGYSLEDARDILLSYAIKDSIKNVKPIHHKYLSMSYDFDKYSYRIESLN